MANCINWLFVIALLLMVEFSYTKIESPCPDVLLYNRGANGLYGDVTVSSQLIKNNMDLKVILSHENPLPSQYEGYIELQGELSTVLMNVVTKLNPIKYTVNFPQKTQYFHILSIDFNGVVLCSGTPPLKANRKIVLHHKMVIDGSESHIPLEVTTPSEYHNPIIASPPVKQTHIKHRKYNITSAIFSQFVSRNQLKNSSRVRRFANSEQNSDNNYGSLFNKKQLRSACGKETNVSNRKWPWITAVYMTGLTERWVVSSGALISDIFVITAAQPVSYLNNRLTLPEELSVRVGASNLEDEDDESSSPRMVQEIIFHPDFKPIRLRVQDNIVLLRIKPLNFNQFLAPVCLIRSSRDIGSELVKGQVIGWGKGLNNDLITHSNEIEMEILPVDECKEAYPMIRRYLKPNNFCARSEELSELCDEEQGKGFYTKKLESPRWVLAGILSYSIQIFPDRCIIEKTRIFSDLSKDAEWIEGIIFDDNNY